MRHLQLYSDLVTTYLFNEIESKTVKNRSGKFIMEASEKNSSFFFNILIIEFQSLGYPHQITIINFSYWIMFCSAL